MIQSIEITFCFVFSFFLVFSFFFFSTYLSFYGYKYIIIILFLSIYFRMAHNIHINQLIQQNSQQLMKQNQEDIQWNDLNYDYNFQYSYAQYNPILESTTYQNTQSSQQQLNHQLHIFNITKSIINKKCFKEESISNKVQIIITHIASFKQITKNILKIIEINMTKNQKNKDLQIQSKLQTQREMLIQNIQNFSQQTHKQKTHYLKLLTLICSFTIFKFFKQKFQLKKFSLEGVFHQIYWEILGQHSTKYILDQLIQNYICFQNLTCFLNEPLSKIVEVKRLMLNSVKQQNWSAQTFGSVRQSQNMIFNKVIKENNMLKSNSEINDFLQNFKKQKLNQKENMKLINKNDEIIYESKKQINQNMRFGNILSKKFKNI